MKNKALILTTFFSVLAPLLSEAQPWTSTGSNVYLSTGTNSVGIGTSTPATRLHVFDEVPTINTNDNTSMAFFSKKLTGQASVSAFGIYGYPDLTNIKPYMRRTIMFYASGDADNYELYAPKKIRFNIDLWDTTFGEVMNLQLQAGFTRRGLMSVLGGDLLMAKKTYLGSTLKSALIFENLMKFEHASSDNGLVLTPYSSGAWDATKSFKFHTSGVFYATEIQVQLTPFPDYVFAKDYHLMPLNSLRTYIAANNKLPNLPSAAEVAENGVGIGELNLKMVEKIEELTLYILELENRLKDVESKLTDK